MDPCRMCGNPTDPTDKTVLCSGSCAKFFHPGCVGLNSTNHKAWMANVGLLWFCDICRVNFNPVVMDREAVLLKTLKDLLIRVDSMDLRIGQYGENLRTLNAMLSTVPTNRRESNASNRLQQLLSGCSTGNVLADFQASIDRINLDSSLQSQMENCSAGEDGLMALQRIGDKNSVHQVPATQPVTKSIQTASTHTTATVPVTTAAGVTTPATTTPATTTPTTTIPATTTPANTTPVTATTVATATAITAATTTFVTSTATDAAAVAASSTPAASSPSTPAAASSATRRLNTNRVNERNSQTECRLRVANRNQRRRDQPDEVLRSFYVTPFAIDQTEADILEYIKEVLNVGNSTLRCAKLVPRGKNIDELTFISFKVTVSEDLVSTVSDSFYWPEGIQIREFESKNGTRPVNLQQS